MVPVTNAQNVKQMPDDQYPTLSGIIAAAVTRPAVAGHMN